MQNFSIAFLIVLYNFPSPERDLATVPLTPIAMMTMLPLYFILLIVTVTNKIRACFKKNIDTKVIHKVEIGGAN